MSNWDGKTERRKVSTVDNELLIRMDEKLTNALKVQDHHHRILHGSNGDKGLNSRILLLESQKEKNEKHAFAAWGAMVGLVFKIIYDYIKR